jgi:hypothetical protein
MTRHKSSMSVPSVIAIPPTPGSSSETASMDNLVPGSTANCEPPTNKLLTASQTKEEKLLSPAAADDTVSIAQSQRSYLKSSSASHILGKLKKKRSRSESVSSQRSDVSDSQVHAAANEQLIDDLKVHYAYLGKHVKDVRIVSPPVQAPKLSSFQSADENGKMVTNWSGYFQAVSMAHSVTFSIGNYVITMILKPVYSKAITTYTGFCCK